MNKDKISFAFFGTPELSKETLDILKEQDLLPTVVVTNPDRPTGRGLKLSPSPVSDWAKKNNIPCLKPEKITEDFISNFKEFEIDLNIIVAYGKILPEDFINIPKYKSLNIHYSLLPKYRGASPLEAALLNNDTETGVSIQKMVYKMDAGPILGEKIIPIDNNIQKNELREILIKEGADLLVKTIPLYIEGKIEPKNQDESKATFCKKVQKKDGEIKLDDNTKINWAKYRAYQGWPGIFFFKDNKRIKITKAKLENSTFVIEKIIPEGKSEQDYLL